LALKKKKNRKKKLMGGSMTRVTSAFLSCNGGLWHCQNSLNTWLCVRRALSPPSSWSAFPQIFGISAFNVLWRFLLHTIVVSFDVKTTLLEFQSDIEDSRYFRSASQAARRCRLVIRKR